VLGLSLANLGLMVVLCYVDACLLACLLACFLGACFLIDRLASSHIDLMATYQASREGEERPRDYARKIAPKESWIFAATLTIVAVTH